VWRCIIFPSLLEKLSFGPSVCGVANGANLIANNGEAGA